MSVTYYSIWRNINWIHFSRPQGLELKYHLTNICGPPPPPPPPPPSSSSPSPSTIVKLALAPQKRKPAIPQCAPLVHPSHLKGPSLQISNSRVPDSPILMERWNRVKARIFWNFLASKTKIWSKEIFNDFCWDSWAYLIQISSNLHSFNKIRVTLEAKLLSMRVHQSRTMVEI